MWSRGRRSHTRRRSFALLLALLLLTAACTGDDTPDPQPPASPTAAPEDLPTGGGTLRIGLANDPRSIDPRFVADEEGELIVGALFEPLVRIDARGRAVPGAARAWSVSDDGTEITFTLREATFHDGQPVTATDVKRTFDRIADGTADPPSFLAYLLSPIVGADAAAEGGGDLEGVEVVDETTVVIRLVEPQPRYLLTLADPSLVPTPEAADEDPEGFGEAPIGNGPYSLVGPREPGGFVRLARVEGHHREPELDEVVLQIYPDDPARNRQWADLEAGLLHVADVGPAHLEEAAATYGISEDGSSGPGLLDGATSTVTMLGFDLTVPPFDDPVVRRALSQSIDRDALVEEVFGGTRRSADRLVPEGIPGSQSGACDHCRYDPEGAAALLEDAEIELPEEIEFTFNRGATNAAVAERIAADVSDALGVEVVLVPLELREYVPAVRRGEAPWFRLGWEANAPDPGAYLDPLFHSRNVGLDNLTRYADEETDELLDAGRRATSEPEAVEAYAAAERRILDAVAVAPLVVNEHARVVTEDIEGLVWLPSGRVDLAVVRFVQD
ncbi:ABC transporter substrate-binding protein [Nitriliruptor alkaliphilus]|uniref:ABC transporter substrate-binding protein n=1 Tax=Nitriliruptor alkaliphilus TaxID=427918 RepID=UPI00069614C5|nr:ABC transporter substrate-binding protein [Nitriliruptor alkaliphilus]